MMKQESSEFTHLSERTSDISSDVSSFNTCESALLRQYGAGVVEEVIGALARAASTVEQERSLWALAAAATTETGVVFVDEAA